MNLGLNNNFSALSRMGGAKGSLQDCSQSKPQGNHFNSEVDRRAPECQEAAPRKWQPPDFLSTPGNEEAAVISHHKY